MSMEDRIKLGLRERKKIKTRASIQQQALRLFREQGYQATTVEQIAEAAEISPSTFFRYFPTKEAVVLEDDYDPMLIEAFRGQPPELTPVQAFRRAAWQGFENIPQEDRQAVWERISLSMSVPELRAAAMYQVANTANMVAELMEERTGRSAGELPVRNLAAAIIGAVIAAQLYYAEHPEREFAEVLDEALSHLEAGFPL
ncbi:acyl-CoA-like ligand-binding transcription factor [Gorillibacterium sp. sgz5001074]|uniref:acyl-CoA-like ligand-binding transcription factor n=1 Tax=Gorillibacterium sp. sgz5001074 TaxID=3446695 RepID=UPI003F66B812